MEYRTDIRKQPNGDYSVVIPDELMEELGWEIGDVVELETVLLCETDTETNGIVISNKTKDK